MFMPGPDDVIYRPVLLALTVMTAIAAAPVCALQADSQIPATPFGDPARFRQSLDDLPSLGHVEEDHQWSENWRRRRKALQKPVKAAAM